MNDYLDIQEFQKWMNRLLKRFDETDEHIKRLTTQNQLEDIKILDNQDMCQLLKVDRRTLQRYRTNKVIPYFTINGKCYYRVSDVRKFIKER